MKSTFARAVDPDPVEEEARSVWRAARPGLIQVRDFLERDGERVAAGEGRGGPCAELLRLRFATDPNLKLLPEFMPQRSDDRRSRLAEVFDRIHLEAPSPVTMTTTAWGGDAVAKTEIIAQRSERVTPRELAIVDLLLTEVAPYPSVERTVSQVIDAAEKRMRHALLRHGVKQPSR